VQDPLTCFHAASAAFTGNTQVTKQTFIRMTQLATRKGQVGRLPLSAGSIWRMVREGRFPQPVRLSENVTAWRMDDVERWEAERGTS
jgi:predicted DNA-binding transcriptional regulator AlpA